GAAGVVPAGVAPLAAADGAAPHPPAAPTDGLRGPTHWLGRTAMPAAPPSPNAVIPLSMGIERS
ncbi:hypothetical protein ACFVW9_20775, partial [Streptomyces sp. NPDC058217]